MLSDPLIIFVANVLILLYRLFISVVDTTPLPVKDDAVRLYLYTAEGLVDVSCVRGLVLAVDLMNMLTRDKSIGIFVESTVSVPVTLQKVQRLETTVATGGALIPAPVAWSATTPVAVLVPLPPDKDMLFVLDEPLDGPVYNVCIELATAVKNSLYVTKLSPQLIECNEPR